jgi:hypothetical protein
MNTLCAVEIFTIIKDCVLAAVAVTGAVVAVRGLRTWNRQLKGGVEYALTRRLLRHTYEMREAIRGLRNPFMSVAEMPVPPEAERSKMSRDEVTHYGSVHGYENRWEPVTKARNELRAALLEAEVLWGNSIHTTFEPLFKLQSEIFSYLHTYLRATDPKQNEATQDALYKVLEKRREVLYDLSDINKPDSDPFSKDVEIAIGGIETFLKPHLKK